MLLDLGLLTLLGPTALRLTGLPSILEREMSVAPPPPIVHHDPAVHRIEIRVRDVDQLFNTMDPSPFHEKDLDADAEEFILSWAQEFPVYDPVVLIVHVTELKDREHCESMLERAVR